MPAAIILNPAKEKKIMAGHPWVFPHAIQTHPKNLVAGDWVEVYSSEKTFIGAGFYNPHSLYRVRMIAYTKGLCIEEAISGALEKAIQLRATLNLPNRQTNSYRLCNSEADALSGLIIDVFDDVLVVSSTAYWVEMKREWIKGLLQGFLPKSEILWLGQRKPLAQDGWETPYRDDAKDLKRVVLENEIQFAIDFSNAQKTGIYIDQRENHARLASLCQGKKVLDLYTYHGGFALHAARAGASSVLAVDSSEPAILQATQNATLNGLSQIQWAVGDAKDYLAQAKDHDVIILDPPKLIPSKKHLHQAKNLYRYLHRELFTHMASGSILMTCNCSSAISQHEFVELIASVASALQKRIQILGVYGPSICHPILPVFPEGHYLTAVLLSMS